MIVGVLINGEGPFDFVLDTGAAAVLVSPQVAARWPDALIGTTSVFLPALGVQTVPALHIDFLDLGAARFEGVNAAVQVVPLTLPSGKSPDGILGLVLFETMLLTMDYVDAKVRLSRGSLPPADGCTILDVGRVRDASKITIRTSILDREHDVILDTGYTQFLILPDEFRNLPFSLPPITSPDGMVILQGCLPGTSVAFGCQHYSDVCLGAGGSLALLGGGAFQSLRITIDRASNRVRFAQ